MRAHSDPRAHEERLRRAFAMLMLSLSSPAVIQTACGSSIPQGAAESDGGRTDATTRGDSGADAPDAAGSDATADVFDEAGEQADGDGGELPPSCVDASDASSAIVCGDAATMSAAYFRCHAPCYYYVDWSCPTFTPLSGCALSGTDCLTACGDDAGDVFDCEYAAPSCALTEQPDGSFAFELADAGPFTISCGICPGVGRRPAGLAAARRRAARTSLGRYFAEVAHLEAASVHAFRRLGLELRAHGAPPALRQAALQAEHDEIRHARVTARLARRFGGEPAAARVRRRGPRSLERVALENAVEGCVRETFGALVARWQAAHARDDEVRACMRRIAADEIRHAALSWAVAEWANALLSRAARSRVAQARKAAVERLGVEVGAEVETTLAREAGLPGPRIARQLVAGLTNAVLND